MHCAGGRTALQAVVHTTPLLPASTAGTAPAPWKWNRSLYYFYVKWGKGGDDVGPVREYRQHEGGRQVGRRQNAGQVMVEYN